MKLGLIFPHQLFADHPVLETADKTLIVCERLILGGDSEWPLATHAKKLLLHEASIELFARDNGIEKIDKFSDVDLTGVEGIIFCRLVDDVLEQRLKVFTANQDIDYQELDTPGFLTPKEWGRSFFEGKKKPFMKTFYEAQRKRMNILVDKEMNPIGGRWSYDDENRKKFPLKENPPFEPTIQQSEEEQKIIQKCAQHIEVVSKNVYGSCQDFIYPISHSDFSE